MQRLPLDNPPHSRPECRTGDQIDLPLQQVFQEKLQIHESIEAWFPVEIDQQIDIAVRASFVPCDRAEKRERFHVQPSEILAMATKDVHHLLSSQRLGPVVHLFSIAVSEGILAHRLQLPSPPKRRQTSRQRVASRSGNGCARWRRILRPSPVGTVTSSTSAFAACPVRPRTAKSGAPVARALRTSARPEEERPGGA